VVEVEQKERVGGTERAWLSNLRPQRLSGHPAMCHLRPSPFFWHVLYSKLDGVSSCVCGRTLFALALIPISRGAPYCNTTVTPIDSLAKIYVDDANARVSGCLYKLT
jgi:hypothetical protein